LTAAGVDLGWTVARASFCPVRVALGAALAVRPCAGIDAGVLSASARGVDRARDRTRAWIAPSAAVAVTWSFTRAAFLELGARAAVPLVKDDIVVDPSLSLYRAPLVSPAAEIG